MCVCVCVYIHATSINCYAVHNIFKNQVVAQYAVNLFVLKNNEKIEKWSEEITRSVISNTYVAKYMRRW